MKMVKDKPEDSRAIKKRWNKHAKHYDEWYETFEGAIEHYVDWQLLKKYLPKNKNAKILDAAGGTGRITLPLAKMGYQITLCDISPAMLDVAKRKLRKNHLLNKVKIVECDVRELHFPDESFDFVLCWDGMIEAAQELIRVTKRRGMISIYLMNKWAAVIDYFYKEPDYALAIMKSRYVDDEHGKHMAVSAEEAKKLFAAMGINVIDIYAVCGWMDVLSISERLRKSRTWDEKFFRQTAKLVLRLSKEPSVSGMSRHLAVYGRKM